MSRGPECESNLSDTLSEEQKQWYCRFKSLFKDEYDETVKFLKDCDCFKQKEWKKNMKNALKYRKIMKKSKESCDIYDEVFRILKECKKRNSKSLVLRMFALTHIPPVIKKLTQLTNIILHDIDIHTIPIELRKLTNLETISISKCPIYEIPQWFGEYKNLTKLIFSRCRLSNVPHQLSNCKNMVHLDIKYNLISNLELKLLNLQHLDVEGNPIVINWSKLKVPNLSILNISNTETHNIPDSVSKNIIVLSWCNSGDIKITSLNSELRYFNTSGSRIMSNETKIKELFSLPCIEYIGVSGTQYKKYEKTVKSKYTLVSVC